MKLLYIGQPIKVNPKTGGEYINYRNYKLLEEILGNENVFKIEIDMCNKIKFCYNVLFKNYLIGLDEKKEIEILKTLKERNYDFVFLSSSQLGQLALKIKRKFPAIKIITFFHNIEYHYFKEYVKISGVIKTPLMWAAKFNEKIAVKYSDKIITINERDSILMSDLYNRKADLELSTSFIDNFNEVDINTNETNIKSIEYLFVGTNFFANYEGIKWFINSIMNNISGNLLIVGKGTEKWKSEFKQKNVKIMGTVDDLSRYYYQADVVVIPILSGGGMKTKTAEALMYGKTVFGTAEAFEGYNLEYGKIGEIFNTPEEFISKINFWISNRKIDKYNKYSRNKFINKYSFNNSLIKLRSLFEK